jgi:hypothetical protein
LTTEQQQHHLEEGEGAEEAALAGKIRVSILFVFGGGCTILQHVTSAWEVAGLTCGRMAKGEEVQLAYIRVVFLIVQSNFIV